MNILFVTAYDSMGQQFNGYILQNELLKRGYKSDMYVHDQRFNEPNVHLLGSVPARSINRLLQGMERRLSLHNIFPSLGLSLLNSKLFQNADIIHLQLLHARQFISLLNLPEISKRRNVVWTIHDPWLTTGHCIHPIDCQKWLTGCGNCPDLTLPIPIQRDTTSFTWNIKKWALQNSNIHLIAASEWMAKRFQASPILSHLPYSVIPFGIDTNIFHPINKRTARSFLSIPEDADVIAFRWTPNFILKGPEYIKEALKLYNPIKDTYIITMESSSSHGLQDLNPKYKFIDMGWVEDREKSALILGAADVFLMPSIAESFGLMAVEAMACGTPVIVFEGTALQDIIHAPDGGIAVPYKSAEALSTAIQQVLQNEDVKNQLINNALNIVSENYTIASYTEKHIQLYENILSTQ